MEYQKWWGFFGSDGALLQNLARHLLYYCFKSGYDVTNAFGINVFKESDAVPNKRSRKGRLFLHRTPGRNFVTLEEWKGEVSNIIMIFFILCLQDSKCGQNYSFDEVTKNVQLNMEQEIGFHLALSCDWIKGTCMSDTAHVHLREHVIHNVYCRDPWGLCFLTHITAKLFVVYAHTAFFPLYVSWFDDLE